jgi:hypothetical protein
MLLRSKKILGCCGREYSSPLRRSIRIYVSSRQEVRENDL